MELITQGYGLLIWQLSGLIYLGFWAYALFDCLRSDFQGPNQKLIWLILILFAPIIGTFLYLSMNRRTKVRRTFQPNFHKKTHY
ncbi:PLDc N-terminal domain-containing protein [Algoriphagus litoralis]|uniref:PLDc N-terminal domain-containing protein n=1 Tax=Algoriphagus litoralis TaxID=2202829 RepID=UPI000DB93311